MYQSKLSLIETEVAIKRIKDTFERELAQALCLTRVSAPLFVLRSSGLNDDLNGVERPVSFDILQTGEVAEIVHSLAKWKRHALAYYGFAHGSGLYTDMNAIRRDETCDALHSIYVDQWDWERVIAPQERTQEFLRDVVVKIYGAILATAREIERAYPQLPCFLPDDITFVTSQELEDLYPDLTPAKRETEHVRKVGAMFVIGIGGALRSGQKHDNRAPDYDDWQLNGDILVHYPLVDRAFELSSMGIRVNPESLARQLQIAGATDRLQLPFHQALMHNALPLTIGGGIGQSRLCMLLLQKAHIGEVQNSIWPQSVTDKCRAENIFLL